MYRHACFLLVLVALALGQGISQVGVSVVASFQQTICAGGGSTCAPQYCGTGYSTTCTSLGYTIPPPSQTRWGTTGNGGTKSGAGFTTPALSNVTVDQDFFLGTLTHFNYPINNAAKSFNLILEVSIYNLLSGSLLAKPTFTFTFDIDETPNNVLPCVYESQPNNPCADKLSYPTGGFDIGSSFQINQVNYTLQLKGFKESALSTSLPLKDFISQEGGSRLGYLFARITVACPNYCLGGGKVVVTQDNRCICDCSSATPCTSPKYFTSNCDCTCPDNCQNGGVVRPTDCSCNCAASTCPYPKVPSPIDCSCVCPSTFCNSGSINNPATCGCACKTAAELGCPRNYIVNSTCLCDCQLTCPANKVRVNDPGLCDCQCAQPCGRNQIQDPNTCGCTCNLQCPNDQILFPGNCTCGPCASTGNWQQNMTDIDKKCTICPLTSASCTGFDVFNADACKCVCGNFSCDLYNNGQVIDQTKPCDCRPCRAGECYCGNGKLEVGEQCDVGNKTDPCCVNCQWTVASCDDLNGCTSNDRCDGSGQCVGQYSCGGSTTCRTITCPNKTCIAEDKTDGLTCETNFGSGDQDLCVRACAGGVCTPFPLTGPNARINCVDNNTNDCFVPKCNPLTGNCDVWEAVADGSACSDDDVCTVNDVCSAGRCVGEARICENERNYTQCEVPVCRLGSGCDANPRPNGYPCNDNNPCTLLDICSSGVCVASGKKVKCPFNTACATYYCDHRTGDCNSVFYNATRCNDNNVCTEDDRCFNGTCKGEATENTARLVACGFVPPVPSESAGSTSVIVFAAAGGAALVGAIVGTALILKKIQKSKLLDPDTWNPDMFSSLGTNPFYKGSSQMVDNRLYEGND